MKAAELRKNDLGTLKQSLTDLLKDQFNLRMQKATGQLGTFHKLKQVRRDIARVQTVINEKQKGAE
jgi:large subunit ribosomal protein L29